MYLLKYKTSSPPKREKSATNTKKKKHATTTSIINDHMHPLLHLGGVEHHGGETRGHLRVEPDLDSRLDLVLALDQQVQHLLLPKNKQNEHPITRTRNNFSIITHAR